MRMEISAVLTAGTLALLSTIGAGGTIARADAAHAVPVGAPLLAPAAASASQS